jgi:hypothetical protein
MKGLIYKIVSDSTDKVYIGSTTQALQKRLKGHKNNHKKYLNGKYSYVSSFEVIKYGNYRIELIKEIEFIDKKNLLILEGYYITNTKNAVNKMIMRGLCRDVTKRDHDKKYYERHAKEISDKHKVKQKCSYCDVIHRISATARHNNSTNHIDHVKYYIWD